jgi:hypothetical protein
MMRSAMGRASRQFQRHSPTLTTLVWCLAGVLLTAGGFWRQQAAGARKAFSELQPMRGGPSNAANAGSPEGQPIQPSRGSVADFIRQAAARSGLELTSIRFSNESASDSAEGLDILADLQGGYPGLKLWLIAVQDRFPSLALTRLDARALPREATAQPQAMVAAQVRWRWQALPKAALDALDPRPGEAPR